MSTPYAKRRRLNEAAKTLQKPFKSPFRTPLRPGFGSDPPSSDPPEFNTSCATASIAAAVTASSKASDEDSREKKPMAPTSTPSTPGSLSTQRPKPVSIKPSSSVTRISTRKGPSKPALTREIMQLRNEIQILTQAQALATSNKDDDLIVLIDRWRVASRAAAEELFATTRDKVNRMGGVGAWKAREKEHKERQTQWDREEMDAEREKLEDARENGEIGHEAYDRWAEQMDESEPVQKEEETLQAADDDSFTMDMMLKTLNIDLDLIGYSKEAQRWEG